MTSRRLLNNNAKILLEAADYIEEHGWCQGTTEDINGRVCAEETLLKTGTLWYEALCKVRNHLKIKSLNVWNDKIGRTKEEVLHALREAAITED